jgi:hypothetical protein
MNMADRYYQQEFEQACREYAYGIINYEELTDALKSLNKSYIL